MLRSVLLSESVAVSCAAAAHILSRAASPTACLHSLVCQHLPMPVGACSGPCKMVSARLLEVRLLPALLRTRCKAAMHCSIMRRRPRRTAPLLVAPASPHAMLLAAACSAVSRHIGNPHPRPGGLHRGCLGGCGPHAALRRPHSGCTHSGRGHPVRWCHLRCGLGGHRGEPRCYPATPLWAGWLLAAASSPSPPPFCRSRTLHPRRAEAAPRLLCGARAKGSRLRHPLRARCLPVRLSPA